MKSITLSFQKVIERKVFKSYLYYYHLNLQCQLYNLWLLNWYLVGEKMNLGLIIKHDYGTFLGVFSKFFDEQPRHFYRGVPPLPGR